MASPAPARVTGLIPTGTPTLRNVCPHSIVRRFGKRHPPNGVYLFSKRQNSVNEWCQCGAMPTCTHQSINQWLNPTNLGRQPGPSPGSLSRWWSHSRPFLEGCSPARVDTKPFSHSKLIHIFSYYYSEKYMTNCFLGCLLQDSLFWMKTDKLLYQRRQTYIKVETIHLKAIIFIQ